jgi:hypothetical protein
MVKDVLITHSNPLEHGASRAQVAKISRKFRASLESKPPISTAAIALTGD